MINLQTLLIFSSQEFFPESDNLIKLSRRLTKNQRTMIEPALYLNSDIQVRRRPPGFFLFLARSTSDCVGKFSDLPLSGKDQGHHNESKWQS